MNRAGGLCGLLALFLAGCAATSLGRAPGGDRFFDLTARVVSVTDGDTIRVVQADGRSELVRYAGGVDTPERCETAGAAATQLNASFTNQRTVTLRINRGNERDDNGRLLAYVYVGERLVQRELLLAGLANNRYRNVARNPWQAEWDGWERQAWTERRGLWGTHWAAYSPDRLPPRVTC
jgi:micrococcal nuclease